MQTGQEVSDMLNIMEALPNYDMITTIKVVCNWNFGIKYEVL